MPKRNPKYSAYPSEIALRPKGSSANSIDIYLSKQHALLLSRALLNRALELDDDATIDMVVFVEKRHITIWEKK